MKKLVYFFSIVVIFLSLLSNSYSQQKDVPISLTPAVGNTLNLKERNYYGLYKEFKGFVNAVFFNRGDNYLITKITYKNNSDEVKDTVIVKNLSLLGNIRASIRIINNKREDNFDNSTILVINTKEGNIYKGRYLDYDVDNIYIINDNIDYVNDSILLKNYKKFKRTNISRVLIKGRKSEKLKSAGLGLLIGASVGAILGYASGDDEKGWFAFTAGQKALMYGGGLGITGGIFGLIIGQGSREDVLFEIKNEKDFNFLKSELYSL